MRSFRRDGVPCREARSGTCSNTGWPRREPRMPDVVIVGGGPVGLLLAILLAQRHVDLVVLEGRTEGSAHSRAIGIHPPAVRVLESAGVAREAIRRGVPITRGEVRCDGRVLG